MNQKVHALYGLTPAEIKLVEASTGKCSSASQIGTADARINAREITMGQDKTGAHPEGNLKCLHGPLEPAEPRQDRAQLEMRLRKFVAQTNRQQSVIDSLFDKVLAGKGDA